MVCPRCGLDVPGERTACPSCGWSPGSADQPGAPSAKDKGWWERNWKWAVPVFAVVSVGFLIVAIVGLVSGAFRSSYAYQESIARARANPAVVVQLGEPIEPGWLVSGNINISGSRGEADLAIPVSGPKGKGTIYATARKEADEWHFTQLLFVPESGRPRINLLEEPVPKGPQTLQKPVVPVCATGSARSQDLSARRPGFFSSVPGLR